MKCIECGNECKELLEMRDGLFRPILKGYKCINCNLEWSQAEHIDDVTYLIQTNKALEQKIQTIEQQLKELLELMKK